MEESCNRETIWTIGHSNHKAEVFQAMLDHQGIETLIDVRSKPVSRFNPQFNRSELMRSMQAVRIEYRHLPELGGLHAGAGEGEEFESGLEDLIAITQTSRTAIMCSEADPASCHREYLIGVALRRRGLRVLHVLKDGRVIEDLSQASKKASKKSKAEGVSPSGQVAQLSLFERSHA